MNRRLIIVFGVLIVGGALLAESVGSSRGKAAAPALFVPCSPHLIAPYGGTDGWSTVNVQANFARAIMAPGKR